MDEVKDIIKAAYHEQVSQCYKVFALAYSEAGDNPDQIAAAESRFAQGLDQAKMVYQRALGLSMGFSG